MLLSNDEEVVRQEKKDIEKNRQLKEMIQNHMMSVEKKHMLEGERYFQCEHDVLKKQFHQTIISEEDENTGSEINKLFSNPNRSNHHIVNAFHHTLVMQKASYLLGREPSIFLNNAEDKKKQDEFLRKFCNDTFNQILLNLIIGSANKGIEYLHIYYDDAGKFRYTIVPAEEIIVIYDEKNHQEMKEIIRYYDVVCYENGKEIKYQKVEWWDKEEVTYYNRHKQGDYILEKTVSHWTKFLLHDDEEIENICLSWGKVPFIPLHNNSKKMTDLQLVKGLIDAYDLISSEGTNNLLDLVDLYWVIQGYGGETANAIARKLQINKTVQINDHSGQIEAKQVTLPVEGRLQWLDSLRRDIFYFGMGVDPNGESLGSASSGVALKFKYSMFHLKTNGLMHEIKKVIRELLWFAIEDFKMRTGVCIDVEDIQIILNVNNIVDESEIVEILRSSQDMVSQKTLLGRHPYITDVNEEMKLLEEEQMNQREKMEEEI